MASTYKRQVRNVRRAAALLDELKTTTGCLDCGFNAWPEALHFDHVDPIAKHSAPGWVRDRSKLTSTAKLNRYLEHVSRYCVVRCANCHAHRTSVEKHWQVRHGAMPIHHNATLF